MSDQIGPSPLPARTCLVIGGARSGKSAYAQRLAEDSGLALVYLATATVWDEEMRVRVDRHRADRDHHWRTFEEPLALAATLAGLSDPRTVVLVDCLTLWLTNLLLGGHDPEAATDELLAALGRVPGGVVLVSNEVGSGIVPENALARRFRDAQGRVNQAVARVADAVVLVAAGLPLVLKPNPGPAVRLQPFSLSGSNGRGS